MLTHSRLAPLDHLWQGYTTVSGLEMRTKLIDDFERFLIGSIFSFNLTDIFLSNVKVMNAPLEIVPRCFTVLL